MRAGTLDSGTVKSLLTERLVIRLSGKKIPSHNTSRPLTLPTMSNAHGGKRVETGASSNNESNEVERFLCRSNQDICTSSWKRRRDVAVLTAMDGKTIVLLPQVASRKNAVFEVGHTGRYKHSSKQPGGTLPAKQSGGQLGGRAGGRSDCSAIWLASRQAGRLAVCLSDGRTDGPAERVSKLASERSTARPTDRQRKPVVVYGFE